MHTSRQAWLEAIKCSASPTQVRVVSAPHPQALQDIGIALGGGLSEQLGLAKRCMSFPLHPQTQLRGPQKPTKAVRCKQTCDLSASFIKMSATSHKTVTHTAESTVHYVACTQQPGRSLAGQASAIEQRPEHIIRTASTNTTASHASKCHWAMLSAFMHMYSHSIDARMHVQEPMHVMVPACGSAVLYAVL